MKAHRANSGMRAHRAGSTGMAETRLAGAEAAFSNQNFNRRVCGWGLKIVG